MAAPVTTICKQAIVQKRMQNLIIYIATKLLIIKDKSQSISPAYAMETDVESGTTRGSRMQNDTDNDGEGKCYGDKALPDVASRRFVFVPCNLNQCAIFT